MTIQNLSLFLADKISNRNIRQKLKLLNDFYGRDALEREEIIFNKLAFTLKNAYEYSPYYYDLAEKYNLRDIFLNFKIDNLKDIPPLDKNILKSNKKFFLKPDTTDNLNYCFTNGSTGGRVSIAYNQEAIDWSSAVTIYCRNQYGHKLSNKEVHLATDTRNKSLKSLTKQFMKEFANNRSNIFIKDFNENSVDEYLNFLYKQKPHLLHGMPSQIEGLSNSDNKEFYIPIIETSGEILRSSQRKNIERFFSTKVVDRYGLAESGIVAYQMPNNDYLSVIDFHAFVEIDTNGEILVTNLNNTVMPLIRYRTGDFCENKGKVNGVQQIHIKGGREHCIALYKDEKINTATIEDLIFQDSEVKDLQFQVNRNKEIISIIIEIDNSSIYPDIQHKVNLFTKTDIGKLITLGKKNDFKLSGSQLKQLRVAIVD